MQRGQLCPGCGKAPEILDKGQARQFTAQVGCVFGPIIGVMEQGVDVVEDIPFGEG